jgi:hypothetical protein
MRYRLIKPDWGKPDGILGPNVLEGDNYSAEFLKQKNDAGYNVYYFPNHNSKPIDHPFLRGSDIDTFTYAFVDMDLKDGIYQSCEEFFELLLQEPIQPNKVIFSGNGLHAYWKVTDLKLETYLDLQLRLIQKFKTDDSIWTALQLMRLPGYNNTKNPDNYKFVTETIIHDEPTTVEDLRSVLPDLTRDNARKLEMHINKLNGIEELEAIDEEALEMPEKFLELMSKSRKLKSLWDAEKGDRSEADFHIATILYEKEFSKTEALAVLLNTNKALSKGAHRKSYAVSVVNSAYMTKAEHYVPSAAEKIAGGILKRKDRGRLVCGPSHLDCMQHGWRTSEVLGLVGSTSAGKTSITLDAFYNMIKNNPEDDDIFIFFSLEMEDYKILEQWAALTYDEPHLAERFYVVSNEDEEGNSRYMNLQDIYCFTKDISKVAGRRVKAIAIDHIGVINKSIDIKRKPDFGLSKRDDLGFGNNRTLSDRELTKFIKSMAKELDVFIVLQSQTTKEKAGEGDVALGLGAAYGVAQFEWDMDYVMTIWQPLKRVRHKTDLAVTAFQYCKNRYIHKKDKIKVYDPHVLFIDLDCGRFRTLEAEEYEEFVNLNKECNVLRKMAEKKESGGYRNLADMDKVKELVKKVHLHEVK